MAELACGDARAATFIRRSDRPDASNQIAGSIARAPFIAGEPIREQKLVKADGSGFMAAILPTGMRAVSTEISPETGAGGFILPNDRVDVHPVASATSDADHANAGDIVNSRDHPVQYPRAGDRPGLEGEERPEGRGRQDRDAGAQARAGRDCWPGRGRPARCRWRCAASSMSTSPTQSPTKRDKRGDSINVVRFGVHHDDDAEVIEGTDMKCSEHQRTMRTLVVRALSLSAAAALDAEPGARAGDRRRLPRRLRRSRPSGQMQRALPPARRRQVGRDRPAARHQGRAGRRSEDRQCGRALVAARLHHRRDGRPDQHLFLRRRRPADRRPTTSRSRATSTACARRCKQLLPGADVQIEGVGDGVMLTGSAASPLESQQAVRSRRAPGRRRRQGRQQHHRARPRPGHAEGDGRRSAARRSSSSSASISAAASATAPRSSISPTPTRSPRYGRNLVSSNAVSAALASTSRCSATLRAMERAGVIRTLAEPNLTAISGEVRHLPRRRRIPDPGRLDLRPDHRMSVRPRSTSRNSASRLNFTPVVLTEGRISLQGDDRGLGAVERECDDAVAGRQPRQPTR